MPQKKKKSVPVAVEVAAPAKKVKKAKAVETPAPAPVKKTKKAKVWCSEFKHANNYGTMRL